MAYWKRRITKELLISSCAIILAGLVGYVLIFAAYWVEHKKYSEKMVQLVRAELGEWKPEKVSAKLYPRIKALQGWSNDPGFKRLPDSAKIKRYTDYFNQNLADEKFFQLSSKEQTRIRNNFFKSNIPDVTSAIIETFKKISPQYAAWSNEDLEGRLPELDYTEFPFSPSGLRQTKFFFPIYLALFSYLFVLLIRTVLWLMKRVRSNEGKA